MASPLFEHMLTEGIAAAERGQRDEARRLLEQAVELDPTVEAAWWWLSEVVADVEDRITCLENVLALNPDHAEARMLLGGLRATLPPPAPAKPKTTAVIHDPVDPSLEDPYQCVYCGQPTRPADEHCPHCAGRLVVRQRTASRRTRWLMAAVVVVALLATWSGIESFSAILRLSRGGAPSGVPFGLVESGPLNPAIFEPDALLNVPFMRVFLGDPLALDWMVAGRVFLVAYARIALLLVLAVTLYLRWRLAYYATLAAIILGMVWDTFQLVGGTTGWLTALLGIALGGLALWLLFRSEDNFPVNPVRMKVQFHPSAVEAGAAFHWGMQYTRQKKHALAAYHFRRAVGRAPMNPEYYKQLGLSYAQIGRYARSLKALGQARQLKPEDPELPQIEALVRELERQAAQRET